MKNKRGQLTLFIIIAIIIVAAILILFFWVKPTTLFKPSSGLKFDKCVEDAVSQHINELALTSGLISPKFTYSYEGNNVPYLCYAKQPYQLCVVQHPLLVKTFQLNLLSKSKEQIKICYQNSVNELKEQGYNIISGEPEISIELKLDEIEIIVNAPTTVGTQQFEKVTSTINNPIYNMLILATTIIEQEANYGESNTDDLMYLYPDYKIMKYKQGIPTTIYIIEDKNTQTKLQFASQSLIIPQGYGF